MNRIVIDHYPTENLPADMRDGFDDVGEVRVTIEAQPDEKAADVEGGVRDRAPGPLSAYKHLRKARFSSDTEVGDHISALRDEWDHRNR